MFTSYDKLNPKLQLTKSRHMHRALSHQLVWESPLFNVPWDRRALNDNWLQTQQTWRSGGEISGLLLEEFESCHTKWFYSLNIVDVLLMMRLPYRKKTNISTTSLWGDNNRKINRPYQHTTIKAWLSYVTHFLYCTKNASGVVRRTKHQQQTETNKQLHNLSLILIVETVHPVSSCFYRANNALP